MVWEGCTCYHMLSKHERYYGLGIVALFLVCFQNTSHYGLSMVALFIVCSAIVCSRNTNIILFWAWMRDTMLSEHECYYGVGMDALVIVCSEHERYYGLGMDALAFAFQEKHDAWYTQYFGPSKHLQCVIRATQATSGEVGQVCIFCAFTLRQSQTTMKACKRHTAWLIHLAFLFFAARPPVFLPGAQRQEAISGNDAQAYAL